MLTATPRLPRHRAERSESTCRGANRMRLSKVMDLFIEDCRVRKLSDATLVAYEGDLRHFVSVATVLAEDAIGAFTEDVVAAYFKVNVDKGNAVSTLITKRAAVVEFAKFCLRRRYLISDPTLNAPKYRLPYRLPRPFTRRERERLMALTETEKKVYRMVGGVREMSWITVPLRPVEAAIRGLLYYGGLRVGTVVKLRIQDIQAGDRDRLGAIRVISKGDREILVPIVPDLATLLQDYILEHTDMRPKSFLISRRHGQPWTVRMVQHIVDGWGRAAGVQKATPHRFRHTAGTEFLETGATLEETQGFLGHANIATTQVYRRVSSTAVADAARRRIEALKAEADRTSHTATPFSAPAVDPLADPHQQ